MTWTLSAGARACLRGVRPQIDDAHLLDRGEAMMEHIVGGEGDYCSAFNEALRSTTLLRNSVQPRGYRIRHEDEKIASAISMRILQTRR
jgi:hypothetical protein